MDLTNRKGRECIFKPMLCQEGYCVDCQIAIDVGNQAQVLDCAGDPFLQHLGRAVYEVEKRRRLLEWKLNFKG